MDNKAKITPISTADIHDKELLRGISILSRYLGNVWDTQGPDVAMSLALTATLSVMRNRYVSDILPTEEEWVEISRDLYAAACREGEQIKEAFQKKSEDNPKVVVPLNS